MKKKSIEIKNKRDLTNRIMKNYPHSHVLQLLINNLKLNNKKPKTGIRFKQH